MNLCRFPHTPFRCAPGQYAWRAAIRDLLRSPPREAHSRRLRPSGSEGAETNPRQIQAPLHRGFRPARTERETCLQFRLRRRVATLRCSRFPTTRVRKRLWKNELMILSRTVFPTPLGPIITVVRPSLNGSIWSNIPYKPITSICLSLMTLLSTPRLTDFRRHSCNSQCNHAQACFHEVVSLVY